MSARPVLTDAMKKALNWLNERGGSGVIDKYGRLLAGGEIATSIDNATWLRLVEAGFLAGGDKRLTVVDTHRPTR